MCRGFRGKEIAGCVRSLSEMFASEISVCEIYAQCSALQNPSKEDTTFSNNPTMQCGCTIQEKVNE